MKKIHPASVFSFPAILMLFLVAASCSFNGVSRNQTIRIDATKDVDVSLLPVVSNLYGEALENLEKGVRSMEEEKWEEAYSYLENSLDILTRIEIREDTDPEVTASVDALRQRVLDTYRFALPHITFLKEDAPMDVVEEKLEKDLEGVYGDTLEDTAVAEIIADTLIYDIPLVYNRRVESCLNFFQTAGREPFELWLYRKGRYEQMICDKLKEAGLPQNLVYQSMVESGFSPLAYSRSHAAGIWQFIAGTGKKFNLRQDFWLDERYDPEKATDAAIEYMKVLYDLFGDWHLAMAGYNAGENAITRALNHSPAKDYWNLPRRSVKMETQNYVPKIIAATLICKQPQNYGFDSIASDSPWQYDTVTIKGCVSLDTLAWCAQTTVDSLRLYYNPSLRRGCTPPHLPFVLRIPKNSSASFQERFGKISEEAFISWAHYKAARRENLASIAKQYQTKPEILKVINGLKSNYVEAGRALIVPVKGKNAAFPPQLAQVIAKAEKIREPKPRANGSSSFSARGLEKVAYKIRGGDNLGLIAERYGVSVADIRKWNNLGYRDRILAGKTLVLYARPEEAAQVAVSSEGGNPSKIQYTVRSGETLWSIARRLGYGVDQIAVWNNLEPDAVLKAGTKLLLWKGVATAKRPGQRRVVYEVRSGDTITKIASTFSVNVRDVLKWNKLSSTSLIKPGSLVTLWVPHGEAAD